MNLLADAICFTFDVEWASDEVIADTRALLDEHEIAGTFFATHAGIAVPGHERAIHPNFRRDGDTHRAFGEGSGATDMDIYRHVVRTTLDYAPEAKGARSHSLLFDSMLLPVYKECAIEYDATYRLELVPHLRPFTKQYGILEIPTYYADFYDIVSAKTGFLLENMLLDQPGLKVVDFHPNLVYANCSTLGEYERMKSCYNDPERLKASRSSSNGARSLLIDLLQYVRANKVTTMTLAEVNEQWRVRQGEICR